VPQAFNFLHIASTGVTTVSGPGRTDVGMSYFGQLHGVVINQQDLAAGTVATLQTATTHMLTIYNGTTTAASTSPTVIGICQLSNSGVGEYIYDCLTPNGLTLQVGSAVAPVDITVSFT
jgi:hypothetical protein